MIVLTNNSGQHAMKLSKLSFILATVVFASAQVHANEGAGANSATGATGAAVGGMTAGTVALVVAGIALVANLTSTTGTTGTN